MEGSASIIPERASQHGAVQNNFNHYEKPISEEIVANEGVKPR
jgi:hypothetical protein